MTVLGPNRWFAAGDGRFHPDNLIIDAREGNVVAIIEKRTGTIVWRLGPSYPDPGVPPAQRIYQARLPRPVDQLGGQHDAHLIAEGLPGAVAGACRQFDRSFSVMPMLVGPPGSRG